jgi:hypothetical protein
MTSKEERIHFHSQEWPEWGEGERKEPEEIYLELATKILIEKGASSRVLI